MEEIACAACKGGELDDGTTCEICEGVGKVLVYPCAYCGSRTKHNCEVCCDQRWVWTYDKRRRVPCRECAC